MGFIEIAPVNSSEELVGIWNNFMDISKIEKGIHRFPTENSIKDGMRFFLDSGKAIAVYINEAIVDYVQGPGAFVFHSAFEIGKYTSAKSEFIESIRQAEPDKFPKLINSSEITGWAVMNFSDTERISFDFSEAVYYDNKYGLNITLQGSGYFDVGITDVLACAGVNTMSEESRKQISAIFEELLKLALNNMRGQNIDYDKLMYHTDEIVSNINANELINRHLPAGRKILSMEFSSIYPDEKSVMEIIKARRQ